MKRFINWLRSIFPSKQIELEEDTEEKTEKTIDEKDIIDILNHYPQEE